MLARCSCDDERVGYGRGGTLVPRRRAPVSSAQARRQAAPAPRFLWGLRIVIVVGVALSSFASRVRTGCNYPPTLSASPSCERHDARLSGTGARPPSPANVADGTANETRLVVKSAPRGEPLAVVDTDDSADKDCDRCERRIAATGVSRRITSMS